MITQQELNLIDQCGFEAFSFALSHPKLGQQLNGEFVIASCSYLNTCQVLSNRIHMTVATGKAVDQAINYFNAKEKGFQ